MYVLVIYRLKILLNKDLLNNTITDTYVIFFNISYQMSLFFSPLHSPEESFFWRNFDDDLKILAQFAYYWVTSTISRNL